jgi:hypothetical protein
MKPEELMKLSDKEKIAYVHGFDAGVRFAGDMLNATLIAELKKLVEAMHERS